MYFKEFLKKCLKKREILYRSHFLLFILALGQLVAMIFHEQ